MRTTAFIILFCLSLPVTAQYSQHFTMPDIIDKTHTRPSVQQVVRQGVQRLGEFLDKDDIHNPEVLKTFIEEEIAPYFDFEVMTRAALGPLGYQLDSRQFDTIKQNIRQQFLVAFAGNLSNYRGSEITHINISGNLSQGRVKTGIVVYQPGQYPLIIELRMTNGPNGWKIYDVSANGLSAVAHYRHYIHAVVQRSGINGLLQ